jgi:hypothetical protein
MQLRRTLQRTAAISVLLCTGTASAVSTKDVWVLRDDSGFQEPPCPSCVRKTVQQAWKEGGRASAVIFTGHSTFGNYCGLAPRLLARTLARISPGAEFVVLDTCYGAQAELLAELHRAGVRPRIVLAPADAVHPDGFDYGEALSGEAVSAESLVAQLRGHPGGVKRVTEIPGEALSRMDDVVRAARDEARRCERKDGFVSVLPTLSAVQVPGVSGPVLVHLPAADFPPGCFGSIAPSTSGSSPFWGFVSTSALLGLATVSSSLLRRKPR